MDLLQLLPLLGVPTDTIALVALAVVGASSILAAAVPQPAPGSSWERLRVWLDVLAMNVGRAANRTAADKLAVALVSAGAVLPGTGPAPETTLPWTDAALQGLRR